MPSTPRGGCVLSSLDSTSFSFQLCLVSHQARTIKRRTMDEVPRCPARHCVGVLQLAVGFTHVQLSSLTLWRYSRDKMYQALPRFLCGQRSYVCARGESLGTRLRVRAQTIQHARQGRTLGAQLSELKPIMLASSVQAIVACNATAPRVCTSVLFILSV